MSNYRLDLTEYCDKGGKYEIRCNLNFMCIDAFLVGMFFLQSTVHEFWVGVKSFQMTNQRLKLLHAWNV